MRMRSSSGSRADASCYSKKSSPLSKVLSSGARRARLSRWVCLRPCRCLSRLLRRQASESPWLKRAQPPRRGPGLLPSTPLPARSVAVSHPALFSGVLLGFANAWIPATALLILWIRRKVRELNASGSHLQTGAALKTATVIEYRTKTCLVGLPWIHIRVGATWTGQREAVKAWIAIADDVAIGVIFAFGGMAIAPICVGGLALGGIVFGGFGAGILCYAGFGIGAWVVGGVVAGLMAVGGCAFGWKAAIGGVAIAHQFALGSVTVAPHANDALANMFVKNNAFFQNAFLL